MKTRNNFFNSIHLFKIGMAAMVAFTLVTFTSCFTSPQGASGTASTGTTGQNGQGVVQAGADILNSLLGSLLTKTLTEESLYGTWVYQSPEVRFESENLLAKAGGQVVAANVERKLESYLSKMGIKKGMTTYTFNSDKTFSITTGGRTVASGTYTFDAKAKTLAMQGGLGLLNQKCTVGMDGTNLCFLYDADKLLSVMNTLGSVLGQSNSTIGSVAGIFGDNYKGMKLGLQMSK